MKKTILLTSAAALVLLASSCKETLTPMPLTDNILAEDTTYVEGTVEQPQARRYYIEELTGVQCTNCPQGAELLHDMIVANNGTLSVISFHSGQFSTPISEEPYASKQNFQTDDGNILRNQVWGTGDAKPSAVFDRIPLGTDANPIFVNGFSNWNAALQSDKDAYTSTPINLYVTSTYNESAGRYDIEATVKFTSSVSYATSLNIFLSQDSIVDVQEYSPAKYDTAYIFNHVFRKALTNANVGIIILPELATKEAGRVFIYRTSVKIDPTDDIQKYWEAKQMRVTAFVNVANNSADKHVIQVQHTNLIP